MVKMYLTTAKENIVFISILNKAMAEIDYKEMVFARNRFFLLTLFVKPTSKSPSAKMKNSF